jgi:nitrite reductase (cytochrome c-552)
MRKALLTLTAIAVIALLVGCALTAKPQADGPEYHGEFKDSYPDEYASYILGGSLLDDDGQAQSHAGLRTKVESDPELSYVGAACLSCKTYEFNELYGRYGMDAFSMDYYAITGEIADYWSCRTCHASGDPTEGADATLVTYLAFAQDLSDDVASQTAVCGQCHNATCDYPKYVAGKDSRNLDELRPYRYGTDADALRKAAIEEGVGLYPDEELGINLFYLGHPDIELFQGSHHQQLGLTCTSCHMPMSENDSNELYHNHNSSGSPLNNEFAMRFCLSCHAEQGVNDTVQMRAFVRRKQAELGVQEDEVLARLRELKDMIITASHDPSVDSDVLTAARLAYVDAMYYYSFQHAGADVPGGKIAHSPVVMHDYLQRSLQISKIAIASLQEEA